MAGTLRYGVGFFSTMSLLRGTVPHWTPECPVMDSGCPALDSEHPALDLVDREMKKRTAARI